MSAAPSTPTESLNARAQREGWPLICDPALAFDNARLRELAGVWDTARGGRPLPMRADFSARALVRHLRDIAFLDSVTEKGAPRRYRFGFYGSGLARYSGDCTGKFLDEIIPPEFLASWYATYDTVLELRSPLRTVSLFHALNLEHMTAESLLAPLGDANGAPIGLLASVVYTQRVT